MIKNCLLQGVSIHAYRLGLTDAGLTGANLTYNSAKCATKAFELCSPEVRKFTTYQHQEIIKKVYMHMIQSNFLAKGIH